eukprot:1459365-Pyramimonas_sp.AAC.2
MIRQTRTLVPRALRAVAASCEVTPHVEQFGARAFFERRPWEVQKERLGVWTWCRSICGDAHTSMVRCICKKYLDPRYSWNHETIKMVEPSTPNIYEVFLSALLLWAILLMYDMRKH